MPVCKPLAVCKIIHGYSKLNYSLPGIYPSPAWKAWKAPSLYVSFLHGCNAANPFLVTSQNLRADATILPAERASAQDLSSLTFRRCRSHAIGATSGPVRSHPVGAVMCHVAENKVKTWRPMLKFAAGTEAADVFQSYLTVGPQNPHGFQPNTKTGPGK